MDGYLSFFKLKKEDKGEVKILVSEESMEIES